MILVYITNHVAIVCNCNSCVYVYLTQACAVRKILKSSLLERMGWSAILLRNRCSAFFLVSMKSLVNLSTIPFITNFSGRGYRRTNSQCFVQWSPTVFLEIYVTEDFRSNHNRLKKNQNRCVRFRRK